VKGLSHPTGSFVMMQYAERNEGCGGGGGRIVFVSYGLWDC